MIIIVLNLGGIWCFIVKGGWVNSGQALSLVQSSTHVLPFTVSCRKGM